MKAWHLCMFVPVCAAFHASLQARRQGPARRDPPNQHPPSVSNTCDLQTPSFIRFNRREHLNRQNAVLSFLSLSLLAWRRPAYAAQSRGADTFYPQVIAGYKTLKDLQGKDWEEVASKGGDEVRRKVGVVGKSSPLFRIDKAFSGVREAIIEDEASYPGVDVLAVAEQTTKVLDGISKIDFLAYSSIFSGFGNGGGGTDFMSESRKAIGPTLKAYKELLDMLKLKP